MPIDNYVVFISSLAAFAAALLWSQQIRRNRITRKSMVLVRIICKGTIPVSSPLNQERNPLVSEWK